MIYKNNNIQINFTDTTKKGVTGSTFETILGVIPISGNTFKNMDTFYVEGLFSSSASNKLLSCSFLSVNPVSSSFG